MAIEHNVITDPEIHEPKGVAAATIGQAYLADGVGSGDWTTITPAFGWMYLNGGAGTDTVSTIGTTAQKLNIFAASSGSTYGVNAAHATGTLTTSINGIYLTNFHITFALSAVGDAGDYVFRLTADDVTSFGGCKVTTSADSILYTASFQTMDSWSGNVLSIYVSSDEAGDTDDIIVYEAGFSTTLLERI